MKSPVNNIAKLKVRESNIELLRIISMILVLVTHACYVSLGPPTFSDISNSFSSSLIRVLCESFSDVCVNVFILISGWFGIKSRLDRFLSFIFQIYFINIILYFIMRSGGLMDPVDLKGWVNLFLGGYGIYWFAKAYIILYIFAPVLNSFAEYCEKRQLEYFLVSFYTVQTILGFFFDTGGFYSGYSPWSFMGLYLLARYMRLYPNKFTQFDKSVDLMVYFFFSLLTAILSLSMTYWWGKVGTFLFQNSSPLIIVSTVYFFLFFTKITLGSRFVAWVSASCFAAYIVHCSPFVFYPYYVGIIKSWYDTENSIFFFLYTSGFILSFFVVSILLDQVRIRVWNLLCRYFSSL